ncbi:asparaginase [Hydrogenophaga sp. PAMC20947]|uniref:asparaginase n=1 Tax=Hydrogenophaga sp. PAMC20947 TaxID=2565558 RepID=UPI00109E2BF8|nr:asparaginase [Hydrogenophaga sp. PAMC20947]QCB45359.1 asparaginase [Hydrogenophaga sp. PAMC20947]
MKLFNLPRHTPIAATFRGGHPENVHYGSFAVVNAQGKLLASAGDQRFPMFTRSSLKPFQAMPLIAQIGDSLGLDEPDIALLCASHNGEPMHTERAARLLAKIGASERDLACGCHTPYFYAATGQMPMPGDTYSRLQHNCSGKHTGMLLLAHMLAQPLSGYLEGSHAVQQAIARSVSHFCGIHESELVRGIDGCSAPNYAVPLTGLAHAFAKLTITEPDAFYGQAPQRIARAMSRYPELVSGRGRNDLVLMSAGRGDWVSKVGADGVQAIASFSRGVGIAAKCSDGSLAPLMVALADALDQLGWTDDESRSALRAMLPPPMKNAAGIEVGEMRSMLQLEKP